ncbi:MAG: aldehyde dehydrogenase (NADP(+)) [Vicinamibacterales bacterium]
MNSRPVLVAGVWRPSLHSSQSFQALNPATGDLLPDVYPVSTLEDVNDACSAAAQTVADLRELPDVTERIAAFLEDYATRIEGAADALVEMAAAETAYPVTPRLRTVELPRTTGQLRQGAAAARGRSWCHATIDTAAKIRSMYAPIAGPVVVFGPNNFPFAFNSVAGGDFVAAIAAGNPVIAKANTSHPGTSRLLAELAFDAVRASGLPVAMVQQLYRTAADVGFALVSHPKVGATGFTGSKHAGLQLKAAADRAGKPIYLEMSSVNPLFVLPGALQERLPAIAKEVFDSCALGSGQFCTRPGLTVVIREPSGQAFVDEACRLFREGPSGTLLGTSGRSAIANGLDELKANGAEVLTGGEPLPGPRVGFANTLLKVSGAAFLEHPLALQTEAFGTVNTIVLCADAGEMAAVASNLEGNLTGSIYSDSSGTDDAMCGELSGILRSKVGRLLNDKMPTGVAVSAAMNHGGPYPATGHPGFTAVGIPASLLRFAALHSYDNVRPQRLPPELQDRNPTGSMWRFIDGRWSTEDVI